MTLPAPTVSPQRSSAAAERREAGPEDQAHVDVGRLADDVLLPERAWLPAASAGTSRSVISCVVELLACPCRCFSRVAANAGSAAGLPFLPDVLAEARRPIFCPAGPRRPCPPIAACRPPGRCKASAAPGRRNSDVSRPTMSCSVIGPIGMPNFVAALSIVASRRLRAAAPALRSCTGAGCG